MGLFDDLLNINKRERLRTPNAKNQVLLRKNPNARTPQSQPSTPTTARNEPRRLFVQSQNSSKLTTQQEKSTKPPPEKDRKGWLPKPKERIKSVVTPTATNNEVVRKRQIASVRPSAFSSTPTRPKSLILNSNITVRRGQTQKGDGQNIPEDLSRASSITNLNVDPKNKGAKPRKSESRDRLDKIGAIEKKNDKKVIKNNNKLEGSENSSCSLDSLQHFQDIEQLQRQLQEMANEKSNLAVQLGEKNGELNVLQKEIEKMKLLKEEANMQFEQLMEENTALRNRLRDVAHSPLSDNEKQQLLFESHRQHSSAPASIATNLLDDGLGGDHTACPTPEWDKHSSSNVSEVSVACLQDKINQMQETHYSTNEELQATLQELTDLQRQLTELQQENERLTDEKALMFDSLCRQTDRLKEAREEAESLKQLFYRQKDDSGQLESAVEREQKLVDLLKSAQEERENLIVQLDQLSSELQEARTAITIKDSDIIQLEERVRTLESTLDAKHAEHRQLDQELAQARDQCSGKQIEINRLKDLLDNARTKINELEQDRTLSDKSELDELLDNARKEKDALESEVANLKEQWARSKNETEKLKEQVSILQEECKVTRNNAKTTQSDLEYKCEKLQKEKTVLSEQLQQFQEAVNEFQIQNQCQAEEKRQLSVVLSETQRNLSESEQRIISLQNELQDIKRIRTEENEEWEKFQNDLLTSVRVANDIKTEAQQDLQKLIMENKAHRERVRQLEAQIDKLKGLMITNSSSSTSTSSSKKSTSHNQNAHENFLEKRLRSRNKKSQRRDLSTEEGRLLKLLNEMHEKVKDIPADQLTEEQKVVIKLKNIYDSDEGKLRPKAKKPKDQLAISKPLLDSVCSDPKLQEIVNDPKVPRVENDWKKDAIETFLVRTNDFGETEIRRVRSVGRLTDSVDFQNEIRKSNGLQKSKSFNDILSFDRCSKANRFKDTDSLNLKYENVDNANIIQPYDSVSNINRASDIFEPRRKYETQEKVIYIDDDSTTSDLVQSENLESEELQSSKSKSYESLNEIINNIPKNTPNYLLSNEEKFALKLAKALESFEKSTLKRPQKRPSKNKISQPTVDSVRSNSRLLEIIEDPNIKKVEVKKRPKLILKPRNFFNRHSSGWDEIDDNNREENENQPVRSISYNDINFQFSAGDKMCKSDSSTMSSAEFNVATGKIGPFNKAIAKNLKKYSNQENLCKSSSEFDLLNSRDFQIQDEHGACNVNVKMYCSSDQVEEKPKYIKEVDGRISFNFEDNNSSSNLKQRTDEVLTKLVFDSKQDSKNKKFYVSEEKEGILDLPDDKLHFYPKDLKEDFVKDRSVKDKSLEDSEEEIVSNAIRKSIYRKDFDEINTVDQNQDKIIDNPNLEDQDSIIYPLDNVSKEEFDPEIKEEIHQSKIFVLDESKPNYDPNIFEIFIKESDPYKIDEIPRNTKSFDYKKEETDKIDHKLTDPKIDSLKYIKEDNLDENVEFVDTENHQNDQDVPKKEEKYGVVAPTSLRPVYKKVMQEFKLKYPQSSSEIDEDVVETENSSEDEAEDLLDSFFPKFINHNSSIEKEEKLSEPNNSSNESLIEARVYNVSTSSINLIKDNNLDQRNSENDEEHTKSLSEEGIIEENPIFPLSSFNKSHLLDFDQLPKENNEEQSNSICDENIEEEELDSNNLQSKLDENLTIDLTNLEDNLDSLDENEMELVNSIKKRVSRPLSEINVDDLNELAKLIEKYSDEPQENFCEKTDEEIIEKDGIDWIQEEITNEPLDKVDKSNCESLSKSLDHDLDEIKSSKDYNEPEEDLCEKTDSEIIEEEKVDSIHDENRSDSLDKVNKTNCESLSKSLGNDLEEIKSAQKYLEPQEKLYEKTDIKIIQKETVDFIKEEIASDSWDKVDKSNCESLSQSTGNDFEEIKSANDYLEPQKDLCGKTDSEIIKEEKVDSIHEKIINASLDKSNYGSSSQFLRNDFEEMKSSKDYLEPREDLCENPDEDIIEKEKVDSIHEKIAKESLDKIEKSDKRLSLKEHQKPELDLTSSNQENIEPIVDETKTEPENKLDEPQNMKRDSPEIRISLENIYKPPKDLELEKLQNSADSSVKSKINLFNQKCRESNPSTPRVSTERKFPAFKKLCLDDNLPYRSVFQDYNSLERRTSNKSVKNDTTKHFNEMNENFRESSNSTIADETEAIIQQSSSSNVKIIISEKKLESGVPKVFGGVERFYDTTIDGASNTTETREKERLLTDSLKKKMHLTDDGVMKKGHKFVGALVDQRMADKMKETDNFNSVSSIAVVGKNEIMDLSQQLESDDSSAKKSRMNLFTPESSFAFSKSTSSKSKNIFKTPEQKMYDNLLDKKSKMHGFIYSETSDDSMDDMDVDSESLGGPRIIDFVPLDSSTEPMFSSDRNAFNVPSSYDTLDRVATFKVMEEAEVAQSESKLENSKKVKNNEGDAVNRSQCSDTTVFDNKMDLEEMGR